MFTVDIPYLPVQETPILLAQSAAPAGGSGAPLPHYLLNICKEAPSEGDLTTAMNGINPIGWLRNALGHRTGQYIEPANLATAKVTVLEVTKQGKLITNTAGNGQVFFMYEPKSGYQGNDRAVFMIEFQGKRYRAVVNLKVQQYVDMRSPLCPPGLPQLIELKNNRVSSSALDSNSMTISFRALYDRVLGQATDESKGFAITLDTTAAGHGWFIDDSPLENEEFLPTANPNEWVAKAGSAAQGKMDMLSVLLHEYGHALGMDHAAGNHDLMTASLAPGVRRLPTLEKMVALRGSIPQVLEDPKSPTAPLGAFSIALLGRMRKTLAEGRGIEYTHAAPPQFQHALNTTLTNGALGNASGWQASGAVSIASGEATLNESATTQTQLSQAFFLGASDRFCALR